VSPLFFKRLSDESLGSRLASGEAAAFDELYRRYSNRLAAYGSHLLGDAASGDDVAQATMMKAYAALREGRVPDRMKPWLYRIAHNAAIDLVVRRRELPSDDLPDTPTVDREPFAGVLIEALATLPDRQRRVYVLREVHGLRIDETAAELALTAPQVEQALFAARNRLAEQLVFGDRLNCVTVQRLAAGPLDGAERRALKTHLRGCGECRQMVGLRGRALTLFPGAGGLEWLRGLGAGLIGGGAPAAAKVGALFATATVAAGVPVAVEHTTRQHAHRATLPLAAAITPAPRVTARAVQASRAAVEVVGLTPARSGSAVQRHHSSSRRDGTQAAGDRHDGSAKTDGTDGKETSGGSGSRGERSGDDGNSHSGDLRPSGGDSSGSGSSKSGSGTSGESGDHGSGDSSRHGGSGTPETSKDNESLSGDGSTSGNDSNSGHGSTSQDESKSGSGDHSDDHPDESTTTATITTPLPPPPTVTVTTGD
jgi:RNA polymerase sigma-70 factor (ECF subfamily)